MITVPHSVRQAEPVEAVVLVLRAEALEDLPEEVPVDPEEEGEINFPFFFEKMQHKKAIQPFIPYNQTII